VVARVTAERLSRIWGQQLMIERTSRVPVPPSEPRRPQNPTPRLHDRLIPPSYLKAYLKSGKNDANDAAAICGADRRVSPAVRSILDVLARQRTGRLDVRTGEHRYRRPIRGRGPFRLPSVRPAPSDCRSRGRRELLLRAALRSPGRNKGWMLLGLRPLRPGSRNRSPHGSYAEFSDF